MTVTSYEIVSVDTVRTTGALPAGVVCLRAVVRYYDGTLLIHTNDHILGVPAINRLYTGRVGPNGEIGDPNAFTESPFDIRAFLRTKLAEHAAWYDAQAVKPPTDTTDPRIPHEDTDATGLRTTARQDVGQRLVRP